MNAISLIDIVIVSSISDSKKYNYPWFAAFVRPLFLIVTMRTLRDYLLSYFFVIRSSFPMTIILVVYIMYFAWMGQCIFGGTPEGVQYFNSFGDAFFNMLVLMTTSNFPDVMLPAYQTSRWNCLFFLSYLIFGLFLMMNLLLAVFYSNFKDRFEKNIQKKDDKRSEYLYD